MAFLELSVGAAAWAGTISGKVLARGVRDNGDAVVYVEMIPGRTFPPPKDPVVLDQINLTFVPHVLPIVAGSTVAFPNSDEVRHNVFSPSAARRFNLGTYPRGVTRTVVFDKVGEVVLLCNVHAEMSAFVIVLQNPYFAVTAKDGSYTIDDVPAGKYVLKAYHERLKPAAQDVEVTADKAVRVDFELRK